MAPCREHVVYENDCSLWQITDKDQFVVKLSRIACTPFVSRPHGLFPAQHVRNNCILHVRCDRLSESKSMRRHAAFNAAIAARNGNEDKWTAKFT